MIDRSKFVLVAVIITMILATILFMATITTTPANSSQFIQKETLPLKNMPKRDFPEEQKIGGGLSPLKKRISLNMEGKTP